MNISPKHFLLKVVSLALFTLALMVAVASLPPSDFPRGAIIHIPQSFSLSQAADALFRERIITSPFLFKVAVVLFHGQRGVSAGDYLMSGPQSLSTVAYRLVKGDQELPSVKVTIPEGSTVRDMAWILLKNMPDFDAPYFIKIALPDEGYLFPDTYYFLPNVAPEDVMAVMKENFVKKIAILPQISTLANRTLDDIVIMASILEREASSTADRQIISGILWKRLDQGMLLQVDAPLSYITSNTSGVTSLADTKIDSLYNTYRYKGLPKGPISNPGLDCLRAALFPIQTDYFYYLSDKKGIIHYAKTYSAHVANKEKYIK